MVLRAAAAQIPPALKQKRCGQHVGAASGRQTAVCELPVKSVKFLCPFFRRQRGYARRGIPDETLSELAASLCVLKSAHNLAGVIGRASLVRYLELALPFPTQRRLPLTAYLCEKPNVYTAEGARVHASNLDPAVCGELLAQLGEQAREPIPESERLAAGQRFCESAFAYGWCINGTTVALLRMTQEEDGLSYINNVVTDETQRGHGYAKALVSSVCADRHAAGNRTMLYADTSYPASNALYRAVGFSEAGRLIGFDFT